MKIISNNKPLIILLSIFFIIIILSSAQRIINDSNTKQKNINLEQLHKDASASHLKLDFSKQDLVKPEIKEIDFSKKHTYSYKPKEVIFKIPTNTEIKKEELNNTNYSLGVLVVIIITITIFSIIISRNKEEELN